MEDVSESLLSIGRGFNEGELTQSLLVERFFVTAFYFLEVLELLTSMAVSVCSVCSPWNRETNPIQSLPYD